MEPLKPDAARAIMAGADPSATPQDLAEYERLLSARYRKDPSAAAAAGGAPDPDEVRLKELERKLFGTP
jgi:hypothetical protein